MKYDVGLVGLWQYNNFGSALTTLCLYKILETRNGLKPILIDTDLCVPPAGNNGFNSTAFLRDYCNISEKYRGKFGTIKANDLCDLFIVGSDQCWRSGFVDVFGYMMFLDFADDRKKKISYSSSFGVEFYEGDDKEKADICRYIRLFDHISVREGSGVDICKQNFGVEAEWVADPILLSGRLFLEEYAGKRQHDHEYIFCYCLDINEDMKRLINELKAVLSLPIYSVYGPDGSNDNEIDMGFINSEVGIGEWLAYFRDASFVVTDSYHGLCLCLLYNKPFISIYNETRGSERMKSLLKLVGLTDHGMASENTGINYSSLVEIDWNRVNSAIDKFTDKSAKWLDNALKSPKRQIEDAWAVNIFLRLSETIECLNSRLKVLEGRIRRTNFRIVTDYFDNKIPDGAKVAFRGGGFHTNVLIDLLNDLFLKKNIQITYIFDNNINQKFYMPKGCKVIHASKISEVIDEVDVIIVSSIKYRLEMVEELDRCDAGVDIIDMYADLECFKDGKAFYDI